MASTASNADEGKAVLHCPRCGYRGKWTDWCPGPDDHALSCPSCDNTIR